MIHKIVRSEHIGRIFACLTLLTVCHTGLKAQDRGATDAPAPASTLHVTHILGFEGISNNANGDMSIQDGYLRFQKGDNSSSQIQVASIRDLTLGEQDRQVGGIPMMLAKSAAPYGGGRMISLFSHKKYDTVAMQYVDVNGGLHGAIFQLNKSEGQVLRSELEAAGAHVGSLKDETRNTKHAGDQE